MPEQFHFSDTEMLFLREVARWGIMAGFAGQDPLSEQLPVPPTGVLHEQRGSFVTLHRDGALRGCIGTIMPYEPLYRNVARMAHAAGFQDPRFPPLSREEWGSCAMEISVLSPLRPCPDPEQIEVGHHGLILQLQGNTGVFLPQVPVEQGWDRQAYLTNLCRKAGLPDKSWLDPQAKLFCYEALVFPVK